MAKTIKNIFILALIMTITMVENAYAQNVFTAIVGKASDVLVAFRNISYVVAGMGLIVFSWGAIAGKISWKHFYNIAIGLFLLSAMGAFISFFITREGNDYNLTYGDFLTQELDDTATDGSI